MRILFLLCSLVAPTLALALDNLETFGRLPVVKSFQISPDGDRIAYLKENKGKFFIVSQQIGSAKNPQIFGFTEGAIRSFTWANNQVILVNATQPYYSEADYERFTLHRMGMWNVVKNKMEWAFNSSRFKYNVAAPKLVSKLPNDDKHVLLSYYYKGTGTGNQLNAVYKVNVFSGKKKEIFQGKSAGNWIAGDDGDIILYREKHRKLDRTLTYLRSKDKNSFGPIRVSGGDQSEYFYGHTVGISKDRSKLYYTSTNEDSVYLLYAAQLEGDTIGNGAPIGPLQDHEFDLESLKYDYNTSRLAGYSLIKDFEESRYLDSQLRQIYADLGATFPNAEISLTSYSADKRKVVARISGPQNPQQYVLYDITAGALQLLGQGYNIGDDVSSLGRVESFNYSAKDGQKIHAYLTLPAVLKEHSRPPLIVLPHGGPESRDTMAFDWIRQFYATAGFAVFQPNFRGSSGYGNNFAELGYGQWGKLMQTDVDDGVQALIDKGKVDAERICVVGGSYGGYVAMFGAVAKPDTYKCAVSFGGISELGAMFYHASEQSRGLAYWGISIGNENDPEELDKFSPLELVHKDMSPILLLHGDKDTVVPPFQSEKMFKAIKAKGLKHSRLIMLKDEDHWFSKGESRHRFLKESLAFINENI